MIHSSILVPVMRPVITAQVEISRNIFFKSVQKRLQLACVNLCWNLYREFAMFNSGLTDVKLPNFMICKDSPCACKVSVSLECQSLSLRKLFNWYFVIFVWSIFHPDILIGKVFFRRYLQRDEAVQSDPLNL